MGNSLPSNYLDEINRCAAKPGYQVNLWLDNTNNYYKTAIIEDKKFCNVRIRDLNSLEPFMEEALGSDYRKKLVNICRSELIGNKNLSAVSDYLRDLVLIKEGGLYLDTDLKYTRPRLRDGADFYWLEKMPDLSEPSRFQKYGRYLTSYLFIEDQLYFVDYADGKLVANSVKIPDMGNFKRELNILFTKGCGYGMHFSTTELKSLGIYNERHIEQIRINGSYYIDFDALYLPFPKIDLPYGVKLLGVGSHIDNCCMAAAKHSAVLIESLKQKINNYQHLQTTHLDKRSVYILSNDQSNPEPCYKLFPIQKIKDNLTLLDIKRSHNIFDGDKNGKRYYCGTYHAAWTINEKLNELRKDSRPNPKETSIQTRLRMTDQGPTYILGEAVEFHWDNTWFKNDKTTKPFSHEESSAFSANSLFKQSFKKTDNTKSVDEPFSFTI